MDELNANPHWHLTKKHLASAEIALHVLLREAKPQYSTVPGTGTVNFYSDDSGIIWTNKKSQLALVSNQTRHGQEKRMP